MKALVVDDSRAIRGILSKVLTRAGFTVMQAADGLQALTALEGDAKDISLMCVDFNMPNMNGIELVRSMRAMPSFAQTAAIMITTENHLSFMQEAFAAGVNEYVVKPFTAEMIIDKLRLVGVLTPEAYADTSA